MKCGLLSSCLVVRRFLLGGAWLGDVGEVQVVWFLLGGQESRGGFSGIVLVVADEFNVEAGIVETAGFKGLEGQTGS